MGKIVPSICVVSMTTVDGHAGFELTLDMNKDELEVFNLTPEMMVRQLRQMAIDLPIRLESTAKSIELKHAAGAIDVQHAMVQ
jgi:hypothetical protein